MLGRAGGNPLFLEEMLRSLIERGVLREAQDRWTLTVPVDQVAIPDTVHAVIAARIDALPPPEKRALQAAAVVGKDCWLGALQALAEENHVDEAVRALVGKDLLVRKRLSTLVGEDEFTFRHILIRDVAYTMIPKAHRWPMHARHAEWLRETAGDRQAEYADFIAHHWLQVIALRRELGFPSDPDAQAQAVANLLLAGDRAAGVYANTTALDHYTRALDLDPPPADRFRGLHGRGKVWMLLGQFDQARDDFARLRDLARETAEPRWEAVALDHLGHSYRRQDQIALALEHLERGLSLSHEISDPVLTGRILNHIGFTYYIDGKHEEAIRAHEEARRLLESVTLNPQEISDLAESLHGLGENLHFIGRFREGIEYFVASIEVSERAGNRSLSAENRYMIAHALQTLGRYEEARAESQRSLTAIEEIGDVWNLSPALMIVGRVAVALGEFGHALDYATRGANLAKQLGVARFIVYNLAILSHVHRELEDYHGAWQVDREAAESAKVGSAWRHLITVDLARDATVLGRTDEAEAHIRETHQAFKETQTRMDFLMEVTDAEGRLRLAQGRPAEARAAAATLLAMADADGVLHWQVPALLLEADAALAMGDPSGAVPVYEMAVREAERSGRLPALWRALAGLAEARHILGQADAASTTARHAREIIERLAVAVPDERLRATFLQSAKVQRVFTLAS